MKLVTIGIPFYNCEDYLAFAIKSVINQTYCDWELILLDDGSTDNSLEIAKSFLYDKRITVISDGKNRGLIYRLNQLVSISSGVYYVRMDADDIMHSERISKQVYFMQRNDHVDVIGSSYYCIDTNNTPIGKVIANNRPDTVKSILKYGSFAHPTVMGKTSWFKSNPYDSMMNRVEDFELWLRTVNNSHFENIQEQLFFYRSVGVPTINKYIKSNIGIIKLLFKRREYNISLFDSFKYSIIYVVKILIYCLYYIFGNLDFLIEKRSKPLTELEKNKAMGLIDKSIQTNNNTNT